VVSTNPFEKYAEVKMGSSFPKGRDENKTSLKAPPSVFVLLFFLRATQKNLTLPSYFLHWKIFFSKVARLVIVWEVVLTAPGCLECIHGQLGAEIQHPLLHLVCLLSQRNIKF